MLHAIGTAIWAPRAALIPAATWLQASALRLETTTLAPCSARRSAIALPMPLVEPVTSATFPVRSKRVMRSCTRDPRLAAGHLDELALEAARVSLPDRVQLARGRVR